MTLRSLRERPRSLDVGIASLSELERTIAEPAIFRA